MNIVLNALENAILKFSHENRNILTGNPFQWLSERLGYKAKNIVYSWIKQRDCTKVGYKDLRDIVKITKDTDLIKAITDDLQRAINE